MKIRANYLSQVWISCVFLSLVGLTACANQPPEAPADYYHCEGGTEFRVRFSADGNSATLDGSNGYNVLFRKQGRDPTIYDNEHMRVDFLGGAGGREALLRMTMRPSVQRCARD